jgi:hypothetical protein
VGDESLNALASLLQKTQPIQIENSTPPHPRLPRPAPPAPLAPAPHLVRDVSWRSSVGGQEPASPEDIRFNCPPGQSPVAFQ